MKGSSFYLFDGALASRRGFGSKPSPAEALGVGAGHQQDEAHVGDDEPKVVAAKRA